MAATKPLRMLPGIVILGLGLALLLHNLDILDLGGLKVYWPLVVVALGLHLCLERKSFVLGGFITAAGVALQVENLGLADVPWGRVRDFWPMGLVAIGVSMLVRHAKDNAVLGAVFVAVGAYQQGRNLGWFDVELIDLWPLAVIAAGLAMLFKARRA